MYHEVQKYIFTVNKIQSHLLFSDFSELNFAPWLYLHWWSKTERALQSELTVRESLTETSELISRGFSDIGMACGSRKPIGRNMEILKCVVVEHNNFEDAALLFSVNWRSNRSLQCQERPHIAKDTFVPWTVHRLWWTLSAWTTKTYCVTHRFELLIPSLAFRENLQACSGE